MRSSRRRWPNWTVGALFLAVGCGDARRAEPALTSPSPTVVTTLPTSSAPSSQLLDRQRALGDQREAYGSPGALAVIRDNGQEWNVVSGSADVPGSQLTSTSRFRIASVTKPIVALLVLQAVSRGELSLDATVSDFVPDAILRREPRISVRMLLDHSSGVFNVGDESDVAADITKLTDPVMRSEATELATRYLAGEQITMPDRIYVALAETHDRYFEPGAGYHYSNVNYQLAAMVLERVTGLSLAELLRTGVTEPLGLRYTTVAPDDASTPEMHGYTVNVETGSLEDATDNLLAVGNGGSGGVISTADELLTIMQAIADGRLLPEPLVADMKNATAASNRSYGLGLATYHLSCGTFYGHAGAMSGTSSIALVSADGTAGTVIALNLQKDPGPNLLALAETFLCQSASTQ